MTQGLILIVLQKITATLGGAAVTALVSKVGEVASIILEAESIMKEIESEFEIMQAFVSQVDQYTGSHQILESWLKHIRKVACDVEDIIDEYAFLLGKMANPESFLKKAFHHSKNIKTWNNIASQLKHVKARLQNLTVMKERYGIMISGNGVGSSSHNITRQLYLSDASYLNYDDNDVIIGHEIEAQMLAQCVNDNAADRTVISICGMGGSGKTTLVSSLYGKQEIRNMFDCYAWITVSMNYLIEDLLSKVMRQLDDSYEHCTADYNDLVKRIQSYLGNKRYLIILDDMWNRDCWPCFDLVFVKNKCRSRVIITTRIEGVASLALDDHTIKIGSLSDEESWTLFSKKAFSKLSTSTCPEGLVKWAKKILVKCQGLPLAIVAIGSLLSYRDMEEQEWRLFYNQLNWQLTNNPELYWVSRVLKLSLSDLSSHLRNCFLYCALFPEDYQIRRRWIIRLWVAEGFVEDRGTETTPEEVAEDYLKELTRRSLIQVTERNEFGRPKRFQVHDLVREMALTISRKEMFAHICNHPDITDIGDVANRVSVHSGGQVYQPGPSSQHLRSFLLFDKQVSILWINAASSSFRLLRVLCLRYSLLKDIPDAITSLFNLHYLDLSRTKVNKVQKSVARLKKLQTLHLRFAHVRELPPEITMLTSLRHLSVSNDLYGTSISGNICRLKHLQTLREVKANKDLAQNLGYLTQLRSLGITGVLQSYNEDLWASIMKMTVLTKLAVGTSGENEALNLQKLRPPRNLEKLYLNGMLADGAFPPICDGFQKLRVLTLRWSGLVKDPIELLSQMVNLVYLNLYCAYDGESLEFCSGWFPKLKQLHLGNLKNLSSIQISNGAIANLAYLELRELQNLKVVPEGLKYLRSLQHLYARNMPGDFVEMLEGDWKEFVQHITNTECV
ncbi:hypothetical protein SETIT_3G350300v2 [Setaria italica]|uniref:AAA+ ATPase domain-containing protein n=1 Tax=Setaria italica TaxID=4555 RepID=K3ZCF1_SETIT|nr:disease resistance protein RPM1 [Setaria italica]RCV19023.1 hypothetical protein SETIT_3G350300v2 [Setaria italica]